MPINNTTANFVWELPDASNPLSYDVLRLINALNAIDAAMFARPTGAVVDSKISTAIAALVDASPATLDTLNELAAALGDDPNFAATMTTSLAGKLAKAGDTMTGLLTLAAAGVLLQAGANPDAEGKLTLVSGALKYFRAAAARELIDDSTAQTMTNKTLTSPALNTPTISGAAAGATIKDAENVSQKIGYMGVPSKAAKIAAYELALIDAFFEIPTNSGITIPANAAVAFPVGTMIAIFNTNAATAITIAITTDTLTKDGTATTGTRNLAGNGTALLKKVGATSWVIMGAAVT